MFRRIVAMPAVLSLAAALSVGSAYAQKKSLVIGMGSADAGKLDPHLASTTPDKGLLNYIFNGLVRLKPGTASPDFIEPDLVADDLPEIRPRLLRHTLGQHPGREPPGLEHHDLAFLPGEPVLEQEVDDIAHLAVVEHSPRVRTLLVTPGVHLHRSVPQAA